MMDHVKVMVDEQTKNTLRQLQAAFADLLSPLEKLNALGQGGVGQEEIAKLSRDVRGVGDDVQDGLDGLRRTLSSVVTAQESLYARVAAIAEAVNGIGPKLDELAKSLEEGKAQVVEVPAPAEATQPVAKKAAPKKSVKATQPVAKKVAPKKPAKTTKPAMKKTSARKGK